MWTWMEIYSKILHDMVTTYLILIILQPLLLQTLLHTYCFTPAIPAFNQFLVHGIWTTLSCLKAFRLAISAT